MDGITVSAIAINVVHCESVRTSLLGGEGSGLSKGAIRFNADGVIFQVERIAAYQETILNKLGYDGF